MDSDFEALADAALDRIERAPEAVVADAELERAAGGFHFRNDGSGWRDTRDASELFAALSKLASARSGQTVRLA